MTLKIQARHLEKWSDNIDSRPRLPALIRRLIRETLPQDAIRKMNFPAYEDIKKRGFDGKLKTNKKHPCIPRGKSVWEFSAAKKVQDKAQRDYKKREKDAQKDTTLIFVSSRDWSSKEKWLKKKKNSDWKDVQAYDANDLQQWLENSPFTSVWLSEQMEIPQDHIESPERFLNDWLAETYPQFPTEALFNNREEQIERLKNFMAELRNGSAISIIADTREEAIAFACAVIQNTDNFEYHPAVILKDKESVNQAKNWMSENQTPYIIIAHSNDVAKEIPYRLHKNNMLIIAGEKADFTDINEIKIELPRVNDFEKIFKSHSEARKYYIQTGGSLSALHRKRNTNPAKKEPAWLKFGKEKRKKFIWLALIGRWDESYDSDKEVITQYESLCKYEEWREFIEDLADQKESPIERTSGDKKCYRLFLRFDVFYAIAGKIEKEIVEKFLKTAKIALGEQDPNRGAVIPIQGIGKYSGDLRNGIADGVTILNTYKGLLDACGDITNEISYFYDDIFSVENAWYSLADILPQLAEASPDDFIRKLEEELEKEENQIEELFLEEGFLGMGYKHPALLRAIELLAWKPERLYQALDLLCKLQRRYESKIRENIVNKPSNSIHNIMRSWMPQTSAKIEKRRDCLEKLYQKHPLEAVKLALALSGDDRFAHSNQIPIWSDDALNIPAVSGKERLDMVIAAMEIIIRFIRDQEQSFEDRIEDRINTAIELMSSFNCWGRDFLKDMKDAICSLPQDAPELAQKIYEHAIDMVSTFKRCKILPEDGRNDDERRNYIVNTLQEIQKHFTPKDIIRANAYLFSRRAGWDMFDEDTYEKAQTKITKIRENVLRDIYNEQGIDGVIELVKLAEDTNSIACNLFRGFILKGSFPIEDYLAELLTSKIGITKIQEHLIPIFGWDRGNESIPDAMDTNATIDIVEKVINRIENESNISNLEEKRVFLLHAIPIDEENGRNYIDKLPDDTQRKYFSHRRHERYMEREHKLAMEWQIKKYIEYGTARLRYNSRLDYNNIPFRQQLQILEAIANESISEGLIKVPFDRSIVQNFLDTAAKEKLSEDDTDIERLARLEIMFLDTMDYQLNRVSFLLRWISKSSSFLIELFQYDFRTDDGEIPTNIHNMDESLKRKYVEASYRIYNFLNLLSRNCDWISEEGGLDSCKLEKWIDDTRELAAIAKITKVVDSSIGKGLAHSFGPDGIKPGCVVCDILERIGSEEMCRGFCIGRTNSRGVVLEELDQKVSDDEKLAKDYDRASNELREAGYSVTARLMYSLALYYRDSGSRGKNYKEKRNLDYR